jgi:hypothetical protein
MTRDPVPSRLPLIVLKVWCWRVKKYYISDIVSTNDCLSSIVSNSGLKNQHDFLKIILKIKSKVRKAIAKVRPKGGGGLAIKSEHVFEHIYLFGMSDVLC